MPPGRGLPPTGPSGRLRFGLRRLAAALALGTALAVSTAARAQSIEPRLFSNAPIGLNFLITGYAHSSGAVVLDPSIPLEDARLSIEVPFVGYARAIAVGRLSGQVQAVVPYAWLSGQAVVGPTGEVRTRDVSGFGDPAVRFAVNLHGAPALSLAEFAGYHQDLVVGVALQVTAPLGQYDSARLVNLGTNRWSFKPEFGFSKTLGRWILEASGAASFFTDNGDFYGGQHRSQDPIYSAQGHVIYAWKGGTWVALDTTYYTGGRTTLDGVEGSDLQSNWRTGLTAAFPLNRRNAIKGYASEGVSTRAGGDFRLVGLGWQYRWGAGLRP